MHGNDRDTQIHGFNIVLGNILGHGSAAAQIGSAHVAGLPDDPGLGHDLPHPGDVLGRGIVGGGFSAVSGVLGHGHAAVDHGDIPPLIHIGEVGVEAGSHIGGQTLGVGLDRGEVAAQGGRDLCDQVCHQVALHTGVAVRSDLLLVGQDHHGGVSRGIRIEQGGQAGVSAHPVVVAIGADEGAVKAHIPCLLGRNGRQVSGEEVLLGDAVLLMENGQDVQLDGILLRTGVGTGTQKQVQVLRRDGGSQGLLALLLTQMGQQVVDVDDRVGILLTDDHIHNGAVLLCHHSVQGQGDGDPLVLADTAIVAGLEEGKAAVLIQGGLLHIQPGVVYVGGGDPYAAVDRLRADAEKEQTVILAEAYKQAQEIKGQGDAEAIKIYGEAFQKDPKFYEFIRTLETYEKTIDNNTTLILPSTAEILKYLSGNSIGSGSGTGAAIGE